MNEIVQLDRPERPVRRRLAAIAFLDVVGYSRLVAADEEATLRSWTELRQSTIEPRIVSWRGRVVDRAGDGIFAEFGSALEALNWAMDVQAAVEGHPHVGEPIRLRIALHLADVIDGVGGEVQGDGVNVAARLQNHTEAGGIIVSKAIVDAVQGKSAATFVDLGQIQLRNLKFPIHAFRVGDAPKGIAPALRKWWRPISAVASVAALAFVALVVVPGWNAPSRERAEQLLQQGMAIKCPAFPCPDTWLKQREFFNQAIVADPMYGPAYTELSMTYVYFVNSRQTTDRKEDLRIAANLATRAVALSPNDPSAHNARASVLRQDPDKLEEALVSYLRVLELRPNFTVARANTGFVLLLLGRLEEAEPYVRAALEAEPKHIGAPTWLNRMGLIDFFLGRQGHGANYFRRAIAQQSTIDAAGERGIERAINLAAALVLNGEIDDARGVVDGLRERFPTVSTNNMWTCSCSKSPRFVADIAKLRRAAMLAGITDAGQHGPQVVQGPLQ